MRGGGGRRAAGLAAGLVVWAGLWLAGLASAQELARSPIPPANPLYAAPDAASAQNAATAAAAAAEPPGRPSIRPRARPPQLTASAAIPGPEPVADAAPRGLRGLLRPKARPGAEGRKAAALRDTPSKSRKKARDAGSVCGVASIKGTALPPVKPALKGCGVADPVRVTSVAGVALQPPPTIDCATAQALDAWVARGLQPSLGARPAVALQIAAGYVCRTRNNVRGAKISEHGRGRAIDIAAVTRSDGSVLQVAKDFRALRRAHKAACGLFGTTLGPGSDGYHEDHLHFDTAAHRNGSYCR